MRMWRKQNPHTLLVGFQIGIATMENSLEASQKIKNEYTFLLSNCTSGYLFKDNQNNNLQRSIHLNIHGNTIYHSQDMEVP